MENFDTAAVESLLLLGSTHNSSVTATTSTNNQALPDPVNTSSDGSNFGFPYYHQNYQDMMRFGYLYGLDRNMIKFDNPNGLQASSIIQRPNISNNMVVGHPNEILMARSLAMQYGDMPYHRPELLYGNLPPNISHAFNLQHMMYMNGNSMSRNTESSMSLGTIPSSARSVTFDQCSTANTSKLTKEKPAKSVKSTKRLVPTSSTMTEDTESVKSDLPPCKRKKYLDVIKQSQTSKSQGSVTSIRSSSTGSRQTSAEKYRRRNSRRKLFFGGKLIRVVELLRVWRELKQKEEMLVTEVGAESASSKSELHILKIKSDKNPSRKSQVDPTNRSNAAGQREVVSKSKTALRIVESMTRRLLQAFLFLGGNTEDELRLQLEECFLATSSLSIDSIRLIAMAAADSKYLPGETPVLPSSEKEKETSLCPCPCSFVGAQAVIDAGKILRDSIGKLITNCYGISEEKASQFFRKMCFKTSTVSYFSS